MLDKPVKVGDKVTVMGGMVLDAIRDLLTPLREQESVSLELKLRKKSQAGWTRRHHEDWRSLGT
jgi:hypothetical protein